MSGHPNSGPFAAGSANKQTDARTRGQSFERERRNSRVSASAEVDSHGSGASRDTEEDVCFPMLREHVRINGIDFDEIEDFIIDERKGVHRNPESGQSPIFSADTPGAFNKDSRRQSARNILRRTSDALLKSVKSDTSIHQTTYDHKDSNSSENPMFFSLPEGPKSADGKIDKGPLEIPDRFAFFHSDNDETVHAPELSALVSPGSSVKDLFKNGEGTWWLDCTCPTDAEMRTLAKAFGIHPLTAEDIRVQEPREKMELFQNYYFVCFQTFETDLECNEYLQPINVYIVVFKSGVLTFQFSPVSHAAHVRRRIRQLREYVAVNGDWIGYALIDDITDSFAPVIAAIEYDADAVENFVFDALTVNFTSMLKTIGECRRKVMTLMRLLSNKADVIKMFAKRCQDQAWADANTNASVPAYTDNAPRLPPNVMPFQPRADIAMYLGDIQDHIVTMFQNLSAYEKIFSRSHTNYLASLQVVSFNSNLTVTKILGNVTLIGTMFFPLNVLTSLFSMNVKVPGEGEDYWFYGIVASMFVVVIISWVAVKWYLRFIQRREWVQEESRKRSIKSFSTMTKKNDAAKSILSANKYD